MCVSVFLLWPAKPQEIKPAAAEVATVNDIAAPPSKELPPSPEKKAKVRVIHVSFFLASHFASFGSCLPAFSSAT